MASTVAVAILHQGAQNMSILKNKQTNKETTNNEVRERSLSMRKIGIIIIPRELKLVQSILKRCAT